MTNNEASGILAIVVETAKGRCFVTDEAISDAYAMAIKALKAQEAKAQLSAEGTTSKVKKTCITCKYYPPESKWPCIDCDMRNPADRWEPQELSNNSPKLDKGNGDLQPTCNQLAKDTNVPCKDTISRQAALDEIDGFLAVDKYYHSYSQGKTIPVEEMRERLKQLPSVPEPEIVRCKDCKHFRTYYHGTGSDPVITHACAWFLDRAMGLEDYCSKGVFR